MGLSIDPKSIVPKEGEQIISIQDAKAYLDSGHSKDELNASLCQIEDSNGNDFVDEGEMSSSQDTKHPGPVDGMRLDRFVSEANLYKELTTIAKSQGYTILPETGLPKSGQSLSMLHVRDPKGIVYEVMESDNQRYARAKATSSVSMPQPIAVKPEEFKTALEKGLNYYLDGDLPLTAVEVYWDPI